MRICTQDRQWQIHQLEEFAELLGCKSSIKLGKSQIVELITNAHDRV